MARGRRSEHRHRRGVVGLISYQPSRSSPRKHFSEISLYVFFFFFNLIPRLHSAGKNRIPVLFISSFFFYGSKCVFVAAPFIIISNVSHVSPKRNFILCTQSAASASFRAAAAAAGGEGGIIQGSGDRNGCCEDAVPVPSG